MLPVNKWIASRQQFLLFVVFSFWGVGVGGEGKKVIHFDLLKKLHVQGVLVVLQ